MKNLLSFIIIFILFPNTGKAKENAPVSMPDSIILFWKKTRGQLDKVPINANVKTVQEPLPYKKYYVTVNSLDDVTISGFLAVPVKGEGDVKPWPVLVTTCGYSGNGQGVQLSDCQRGYIVLQVYPRGQGMSGDYFTIGSDKLSTNALSPEHYYYRGGYMDIIRMIDYIVTRTDVDTSRIAMVGTSQAGGISLAVTALDNRVKAVVAQVPFLCNLRMASRMPSLAKSLLDKAGSNNEKVLGTLDYFDPYVLADQIKVPVFMSGGGKDVLCPAATVKSVYDRIKSIKEYQFYPDLPHTSCMDSYARSWSFLDKYLLGR